MVMPVYILRDTWIMVICFSLPAKKSSSGSKYATYGSGQSEQIPRTSAGSFGFHESDESFGLARTTVDQVALAVIVCS